MVEGPLRQPGGLPPPRDKLGEDLHQTRSRFAAIRGAFAADLRAQLAMFMVVLLAFGGASLAHPGAQLEQFAQHRLVVAGAPRAQSRGRLANVRAIEAQADALRQVVRLSKAGVGARQAHFRAIHQMMHRIAERLVIAVLGVKRDHLANGHDFSCFPINRSMRRMFRLSKRGGSAKFAFRSA